MKINSNVLFIPHGGGPLPILKDKGHLKMIEFLENIKKKINKPSSIIIISAHWESDEVRVTSNTNPPLLYDYYGFPDETYNIKYPASGNKNLANKIKELLLKKDIKCTLDDERGFDHGVFIPLKMIYPDASIPCVQLSLLNNLNPKKRIEIGKALKDLLNENVLILGSGMSFHNMRSLMTGSEDKENKEKNIKFNNWLIDTFTNKKIDETQREKEITNWTNAPFARFCHPREEHLIPLFVCYGIKEDAAELVFNDNIMGQKCSAFLW